VTALRQPAAKPAARRAYVKPRVERVAIKPDEALLACACKNHPQHCQGPPSLKQRS
jgi:hypothetical protein